MAGGTKLLQVLGLHLHLIIHVQVHAHVLLSVILFEQIKARGSVRHSIENTPKDLSNVPQWPLSGEIFVGRKDLTITGGSVFFKALQALISQHYPSSSLAERPGAGCSS